MFVQVQFGRTRNEVEGISFGQFLQLHVACWQFLQLRRFLINPVKKFRTVLELIFMHVGRWDMWFGDNFVGRLYKWGGLVIISAIWEVVS